MIGPERRGLAAKASPPYLLHDFKARPGSSILPGRLYLRSPELSHTNSNFPEPETDFSTVSGLRFNFLYLRRVL